MRNHRITRRRTRSVSAARSAWGKRSGRYESRRRVARGAVGRRHENPVDHAAAGDLGPLAARLLRGSPYEPALVARGFLRG